MIETSSNRIMYRVVHNDMTSIIHRLQLFYSCSKSAAMISNVVFISLLIVFILL